MASYDVAGKVALVTGGGSGIGEACARTLAASGARVVVADLDGAAAERVSSSIGQGAHPTVVDVTDPASVEAAIAAAVGHFGSLHLAVNNAGIGGGGGGPTADVPIELWRRVLSVNLDGVFHCLRAEIPYLLDSGGGSIVNIASVLGSVALPGASAYVASKHGVVGLTQAVALEYAGQGIRVNAVGPGFVRTPLLGELDDDRLGVLNERHALGRIGRPQEVADLVAWLVSDAASFATGGYYPIDGGYLAR